MPLFGPPNIENMEAKGDVKGLIKAMNHYKCSGKNSAVSVDAARALGRIGDLRAVDPLVATALGDALEFVREAAADALGQIGMPAVEPIITALKDEDWDVREAAAKALGRIGHASVVEPLAALMGKDRDRRSEAARTLGRIGDPLAVGPLIVGLEDPSNRQAASWALGQIGDARAVQPLVEALKHAEYSSMAIDIIEALGRIGDSQAVKPLVVSLSDRTQDVRNAAVKALDWIGWQPDQGEAGAVYWAAKGGWGRCVAIGIPAVQPLITCLNHWGDADERESAARALGEIGNSLINTSFGVPEQLIGFLIGALNSETQMAWNVRRSAAAALIRMYKSGRLTDLHRQLILQQRKAITERHIDYQGTNACGFGEHRDTGIGIDFPI